MNDTPLARWERRIERAAALIADRLDDPPSLDELASAAAVSPFHFHRIWRGLTGETVHETVSRLRIEASKHLLAETGASVTQAAMATGYGTPQSFARAFRSVTGVSPSAFAADPVPHAKDPLDTEVRIVLRDGVRVVALRRTGGDYVSLNATFQAVWDWAVSADVIGQLEGLYGIPLDDPGTVPVDALRYDACLALGDVEAPSPMHRADFAAGPYACLRHHGSYDGLEDATQRLIGAWLPLSGREPADAPLHYHFHNDHEQTPEAELVTDVMLPLR